MSVIKTFYCDCCGVETNAPGVGSPSSDGVARVGQLKARVWTSDAGLEGYYLHACGNCTLKIDTFLSNLIVLKSD